MFDPLGGWNASAPADLGILNAARAFVQQHAASFGGLRGLITRLYLHWSVAPFGCTFGDYHFMINLVDGSWVFQFTHDPRDNAPGLNNNPEASHTWHRNTGAIGIAIGGMDNASVHDFGPDGVQRHELEYLCALAAVVCAECGIDASGVVPSPGSNHADNNGQNVNTTGEHTILTHGECAVIDAYPSERWDLGCLVPLPSGVELTPAMRTQSGDALRQRIHVYKAALS